MSHLLDGAAQLLLQLLLLLGYDLERLDGAAVIGVLEQDLVHVLELAAGAGARMASHTDSWGIGHSLS